MARKSTYGGHSDPILKVFFDFEILPELSFWLSTARHEYSPYYIKLADYYMDFQIVSGALWFQSIFKLLRLVKEIRYLTNKQSFG